MYTNKLRFVICSYIEENNNFKFFSVHFLLTKWYTSWKKFTDKS